MASLKVSTATTRMLFMTDATDHVTGKASLTLTVTASKAGGAFATITPSVTDRGSGWYAVALTAAHTDTVGELVLHATATGADPTDKLYDVTVAGADANVTYWAGSAVDALTVSDVVLDGGTVSASPAPTATGFTATGGNLHALSGAYSVAPMAVLFTSGANRGVKVPIVSGDTGHVRTGSNHVFTFQSAFKSAPAAGDTFVIG